MAVLFTVCLAATNLFAAKTSSIGKAAVSPAGDEPEPAGDTIRLVVVSAGRESGLRNQMTRRTLVTMSQIPEAQASTLEQLLRMSPSIDIRERGGKSIQTDIGIRGGSPDQTMVQLNGIDFTDARTGHQSHGLPVDADILDGMDLIEGIGGNTGLAGAVNIRVKRSDTPFVRANLTGGSHGYAYGNLSGAAQTAGGRLHLLGAGSLRRSDGYRPCTDFKNYNAYLRGLFEGGAAGTFDVQAGWQRRSFGAAGFYSLAFPEQFERTSTSLASVRWMKSKGSFSFDSWLSWRQNSDCFQLIRGDESRVPYNHHRTDNHGAHAAAGFRWGGGTTTLVANYAGSRIMSTVLGDPIEAGKVEERRLKVRGYDRSYTKMKARHTGDAFLRHEWQHGPLSAQLSAGAAFSTYGTAPLWNAHADWCPAVGWHFDAGMASSMRLPTFTDLYYTAPGHQGNPDLRPEKALTVKAGGEWVSRRFGLAVTGFHRHGTNMIDWVREDASSDWKSMQVTKLGTCGADVKASWQGKAWLRGATLQYGHLWSDKRSGGMISRYALDYLQDKVSASLHLASKDGRLDMLLAGTLYNRNGNYAAADGTTRAYRPFFLLNGNIGFETGWIKHGSLRLYIEAENITDTEYFDYGGLSMPGLWLNAGIAVKLWGHAARATRE